MKADKTKFLKSFEDQLLTANNRIGELDGEKAVAYQQVKLLEVCVYVHLSCSGVCICVITYSVYIYMRMYILL